MHGALNVAMAIKNLFKARVETLELEKGSEKAGARVTPVSISVEADAMREHKNDNRHEKCDANPVKMG